MVSTDDDQIAQFSERMFATVIRRPATLAGDDVTLTLSLHTPWRAGKHPKAAHAM